MDFSPCAIKALRFANKLAIASNAELLLINVVQQPHVHVEAMGAGAIMTPVMTDLIDQAQENFKKLIDEESLSPNQTSSRVFSAGFIDAITTCLNEESIDLIITGTHENHDFLDSMFGSKSADIITTSDVPVLMIPEHCTIDKIKKIGVAVDFSDDNDLSKFEITKYFTDTLGASLVILNIADSGKKLFHHDDEKVAISNFFKGIEHLFFTINNKGDLVSSLQDSSKELGLSMLFMHPKNHSGIGGFFHKSKTKSMAMNIDIPLLTVHE